MHCFFVYLIYGSKSECFFITVSLFIVCNSTSQAITYLLKHVILFFSYIIHANGKRF